MLLMDQVGISIRGSQRRGAERLDGGGAAPSRTSAPGNASVIGDGAAYSPPAAALFNGNLGHSLDFDDTHASGSIHPSAPIVPAALAAAEMVGANGRTVVAAVVAGYEVQIRLSLALGPVRSLPAGIPPHADLRSVRRGGGRGPVLGLDASQMEDAFGLCGSLAAGSMQFLVDGAWNKPFHTGYAAMNGLVAACMAREGFRGAREAIEGRAGFLHAYAPNANPSLADAELGEQGGRRCASRSSRIRPAATATRRWTHSSRFARARHRLARRRVGGNRSLAHRMGHHRRSGRREAAAHVLRRRTVLHAVLRRGGPARRHPHVGLLRDARRQSGHSRSLPGASGPSSTIRPRRISPTRCPDGPGSRPRTGRSRGTCGHPRASPRTSSPARS